MNDNEIRRLACAIGDLRPDWPVSSLTTFIRNNLAVRPYRDTAVAFAWVATDTKVDGTPASDTPKRILEAGPWWQAAVAHDGTTRTNHPPRRDQECATHPGQWAENCGPCRTDQLAGDHEPSSTRPRPGDATAGLAACREGLRT